MKWKGSVSDVADSFGLATDVGLISLLCLNLQASGILVSLASFFISKIKKGHYLSESWDGPAPESMFCKWSEKIY